MLQQHKQQNQCTAKLQPCDVIVQRSLKAGFHTEWFHSRLALQRDLLVKGWEHPDLLRAWDPAFIAPVIALDTTTPAEDEPQLMPTSCIDSDDAEEEAIVLGPDAIEDSQSLQDVVAEDNIISQVALAIEEDDADLITSGVELAESRAIVKERNSLRRFLKSTRTLGSQPI